MTQQGRIARYKAPKSVEFVDSLPKNPSGKILKRELIRERPRQVGRERFDIACVQVPQGEQLLSHLR